MEEWSLPRGVMGICSQLQYTCTPLPSQNHWEIVDNCKPLQRLSVVLTHVAYQEEFVCGKKLRLTVRKRGRSKRSLAKKALIPQSLESMAYSVHVCSAETSAAAALGVPDRFFQRIEGWRSEKAQNNYVKESLDLLLQYLLQSQWMDFDIVLIQLLMPTVGELRRLRSVT